MSSFYGTDGASLSLGFSPSQNSQTLGKGVASMSTVKINLFGQLSVECDEKVWCGPEGCKSRELFCYLLIHRAVPHNRERLASLLWEESSTAQSKKYLRQTLWQLHIACDEHLGEVDGRLLLVS